MDIEELNIPLFSRKHNCRGPRYPNSSLDNLPYGKSVNYRLRSKAKAYPFQLLCILSFFIGIDSRLLLKYKFIPIFIVSANIFNYYLYFIIVLIIICITTDIY